MIEEVLQTKFAGQVVFDTQSFDISERSIKVHKLSYITDKQLS